jgi:hypothetical protein
VINKTKFKKAFFKYGVKVPESYRMAISGTNGPEWKLEMDKEVATLSELGAFLKGLTVNGLSTGHQISDVIRSTWVYDVKVDGRKRARFAARGDVEAEDPDSDNFSPVAQMRTVRVLLAVAVQLNLELVTMDFPKAFLLGKMDKSKPIYMHAPGGYGVPGEIWSIRLPLYGLTVSSRRFYESLSEFMRAVGFHHFAGGDPCLFRRNRQLPNEKQAMVNHASAQEAGLPGRPTRKGQVLTQALPQAPTPSRVGPSIQVEVEHPEYMDSVEYKDEPNVAFEIHHAEGLNPTAMNGLFPGEYYELAVVHVDDLLGLTHHSAALAALFILRFAATISPPGSMYLGLDYEQNLEAGYVAIGFQTCLERTIERITGQTAEEIGIRSLVGILLWVTLHIFATHLVEVKSLARRTNQNLVEDGKTALALVYELHQRRGQRIYYRRCDNEADRKHLWVPRTSRIAGITDVSKFSEGSQGAPEANGEVMVTPKDTLEADDGIDLYCPEIDDGTIPPETLTIDPNFHIRVPTDASYAADQMSRRSDLASIVFINGGPVDWCATRMTGIADSSFNAECCAMSIGTKQVMVLEPLLQFTGVQPMDPLQDCDSTSATQVALNPHKLGASRSLGIRQHLTRYAIAKGKLKLCYSVSEDCVADMLTKRLQRQKLARFALIFFNNLRVDWRLDPDHLAPLRDHRWYPDLDLEKYGQPMPDDENVLESDSVQVLVQNPVGSTMPMIVPSKMTIANLKVLIHTRTEMRVSDLRILHAGRDLRDGDTVQGSGIIESSIIIALLRMRGGKNTDESDDEDDFDGDLPELIPLENHETALRRWNELESPALNLAQYTWMLVHMPDNYPPGWAPNAMIMLQMFAKPEYYEPWNAASSHHRVLMMRVYATLGPWPNPIEEVVHQPPHGVQVAYSLAHDIVTESIGSSSVTADGLTTPPDDHWLEAMRVERENLIRRGAIELTPDSLAKAQRDADAIADYKFYFSRDEDDPRVVSPPRTLSHWTPPAPPQQATRVPITRHDRVPLVLRTDIVAEADLREHFSGLHQVAAEVGRPMDIWEDTSEAEADLLSHFSGLHRILDQVNEAGVPISTSLPLRTPCLSSSVAHRTETASLTEDLSGFDINEDLQECINTDVYNCPE